MKIILVTLCTFLINLSFAQREPIDLTRQLLSEGGVIDTINFYSDELDLRPGGITGVMMSNSEDYQDKKNFLPDFTGLISKYDFEFRQFIIDTTHQIINVTATDSLINGFDFYLHFKKEEEIWKLTDLQKLNRGIVAHLWMVNYTDHQVDSIVNSDNPQKVIRSKEQFESIKELYKLTMNFDDSIISYFVSNKEDLINLEKSYREYRKLKGQRTSMTYGTLASINTEELLITEIFEFSQLPNDLLVFYILKNSSGAVGYLHLKDKSLISRLIAHGNIFFIRDIGDDWYMFKGKRPMQ